MRDRALTIAFLISMGVHLVFFLGQFVSLRWFGVSRSLRPIDVIYESEAFQRTLQNLEEQLLRAKRETALATPAAPLSERTQIRIPERPALTSDAALSHIMAGRAPVVDLANLADASGGNPVLLSYFGLIRDQIQRTANTRPSGWIASVVTVAEALAEKPPATVPSAFKRAIRFSLAPFTLVKSPAIKTHLPVT